MECTLCAETSTYFGLPECEHKEVCSLCWFRMLVQLKSNHCPVCRAVCQTIFIVSDASLAYTDLTSTGWGDSYTGFTKDLHSGLHFESKSELNRLTSFKKITCLLCRAEFRNVTEYKNHAREIHKKVLCEQCMQSSKLFPSEQNLFEEHELASHKNSLHKKCNVCGQFFYDSSGLVAHIKNSHYFCDFCPFEQRVAYLDQLGLEKHYKEKHFYCELFECKRQKCFVFRKYEDFQEHYRKEHPGQTAPKPAMGLRVGIEEEKCVFEDNNQKRGQPASVSNTLVEFPALGAPVQKNSRALDYSKVIQKPSNIWVQPSFAPPSRPERPKPKEQSKQVEKPSPRLEVNERIESPAKPSVLDQNISRLNNQSITKEEFIEFVRKEQIIIDNQLKVKLRDKILSNSDAEFIVFHLENPRKFNQISPFEEKKAERFEDPRWPGRPNEFRALEEKKSAFKGQPDQVRGNSRPLDELSDKDTETLLENICLLNIGLIDAKDFASSIKEFIQPNQMSLALEIIQGNLKEKSNFSIICSLIDKKPARAPNPRNLNPANNRFVDSQAEARPVNNRNQNPASNRFVEKPEVRPQLKNSYDFPPVNHEEIRHLEETLTENLELYKSKVLSITELVKPCAEIITPDLKEFAFDFIRKSVKDSNQIINKLNQIMENSRNSNERDYEPRDRYARRPNRSRRGFK